MEPNYVNSRIGEKIKDLRNKNGLTQQELADRTELTKGYISQLERGQVAPSVVTLLDLIECLGTTASDFFKEAEMEPVVEVNTDELMTMDHKVELATYMKEKGLDPKLTIVEAAKSLGTDVPLLKESDFEKVKEYVDKK